MCVYTGREWCVQNGISVWDCLGIRTYLFRAGTVVCGIGLLLHQMCSKNKNRSGRCIFACVAE